MEFPTLINWTLRVIAGIFINIETFNSAFSKPIAEQKVERCKYSLQLAKIYYNVFGIFMKFFIL